MDFYNKIMLYGLAAVAIPIIIHILNRRRARVVEWGAMRFLEASLASRNRRIQLEEILLMALRCLLLAALAFALARPWVKGRVLLPGGGEAQDVAIVLDGSMSMRLDSGGRSNFQRAIDEAHQLVGACRPSDTLCLVLAGPTAQSPVPSPISDRRTVHEALDEMTPPGGSMSVLDGLSSAVAALSAGGNPVKRIVLITDGQNVGWELNARQRWTFLGESTAQMPTPPAVIVRTLELPQQWRNASVSALTPSRPIVGLDRPVGLTVTVANTGKGDIAPEGVELIVDGQSVERQFVKRIAQGASASAVFSHHFKTTGPHVVTARLLCEDDLPADNELTRVVDVIRKLPVLIVEGASGVRPRPGDADFLLLAMSPPGEDPRQKIEQLFAPTVVAAADVGAVKKFSEYAVVVLADVPRLPAGVAKELMQFAAAGGLLIAPGNKADRDFYNNWTTPDGRRLLGCRLVEIKTDQAGAGEQQTFAHVSPNTLDHPAVKLLSDPAGSDLAQARVKRHWQLAPDAEEGAKDSDVSVGGALDSGEPCIVQRKLARGFVVSLGFSLDAEFTDLPRHDCYVSLVHELLYYLALPAQQPMNVLPGEQIRYTIPGKPRAGEAADMIAPNGKRWPVKLQAQREGWVASFSATAEPGLYRLGLSNEALGELATRPAIQPTSAAASAPAGRGVPFVVLGNPDESRLEQMTGADYDRAGEHVHLVRANSLGEIVHAVARQEPVQEIWAYVALALLALLLAECILTRLIAMRRKAHLAAPVAFGANQVDAEQFRAKARDMLAAPAPPRRAGHGVAATSREAPAP